MAASIDDAAEEIRCFFSETNYECCFADQLKRGNKTVTGFLHSYSAPAEKKLFKNFFFALQKMPKLAESKLKIDAH